MNAKKIFYGLLIFFIIGIILNINNASKTKNIPLEDRYPSPWRLDFNLKLSKSLANNNITDCGEYKYRESKYDKGEYLVYCITKDGNYSAYIAWPEIGRVTGPHKADYSLD